MHQGGRVDFPGAQSLPAQAGKRQQIIDQFSHALGAFADDLKLTPAVLGQARTEILHDRLRKAIDRAQWRPQVVRHRVGKRFQFAIRRQQFRCALLDPLLQRGIQAANVLFRPAIFHEKPELPSDGRHEIPQRRVELTEFPGGKIDNAGHVAAGQDRERDRRPQARGSRLLGAKISRISSDVRDQMHFSRCPDPTRQADTPRERGIPRARHERLPASARSAPSIDSAQGIVPRVDRPDRAAIPVFRFAERLDDRRCRLRQRRRLRQSPADLVPRAQAPLRLPSFRDVAHDAEHTGLTAERDPPRGDLEVAHAPVGEAEPDGIVEAFAALLQLRHESQAVRVVEPGVVVLGGPADHLIRRAPP